MKNNNGVVYERLTVLAVHILNASDIPFEKDCDVLLEQYRRFLFECSEMMIQSGCCADIAMYNNTICGIFTGRYEIPVNTVVDVAVQIQEKLSRINDINMCEGREKMIFGIGMVSGIAAKISVGGVSANMRKNIWLGTVIERAHSLSLAAIQNGNSHIFHK